MKKTAGTLYVRFLIAGVIILFLDIVGLKVLGAHDHFTTLILAGSIFIINFLTVAGYSLAVVKNEFLLVDEDAPDLAYYLGFSLTVASLAWSFISDVGLASTALANSNLVKGSLAQFGSGLLATLIGLSAKIYISSRQSNLASNPEVLYQTFRKEIRGFENSLMELTTSLTASVTNACRNIDTAASTTANSIEQLSEKLTKAATDISENLSPQHVAIPVQNFAKELLKLKDPSEDLRTALSKLVNTTNTAESSVISFNSSLKNANNSVSEGVKVTNNLSVNQQSLNDISQNSIQLISEQNELNTELNKQLFKTKNSSLKISENFDLVSSASEKLLNRNEQLEESMALFTNSINNTSESILKLRDLTKSFEDSLQSSGDGLNSISTRTAELKQSLDTALDSLNNFASTFNLIPGSIDRSLNSFNALTSSINATSSASDPLRSSLVGLTPPVNGATDAVKNLHQSINKLNQDMELFSKVVKAPS